MDVDKLKKWLEVAEQFQGKEFWNDIFDSVGDPNFTNSNNENRAQKNNKTEAIKEQPPIQPPIDLYQTGSEWIVIVDLPGIRKDDLELSIYGNTLTIKGEARPLYPNAITIHSERLGGEFERTINLPENLDDRKPLAKFHDGLLEIHIPRLRPKSFRIDIES